MKIDRHKMVEVQKALARQAAVAIVGPRQVGKTTLALDIKMDKEILYFDLEKSSVREELNNRIEFLGQQSDKLVILDEIHKAQYLLPELRGIIDEGRRIGKGVGRFLILGSASFDVFKLSGESLAGRIEFIELNPLNILEVLSEKDNYFGSQLETLWIRGGYPGSLLAKSEHDSYDFRKNFIKTHIVRDMAQFKEDTPVGTIERFWEMLAKVHGSKLDTSKFAKNFSTSDQKIGEYVDFLSDIFLVRKLQLFTSSPRKTSVKSPKVYIRDSGILHALLNVTDFSKFAEHPVFGNSWEGFVIESLLSALSQGSKASFYRDDSGAEIDLVLELSGIGEVWAVEIKKSSNPKLRKEFFVACNAVKPDRKFLVYSGPDKYQTTEDVTVISVGELAKMLYELSE